MRTTRRTAIKLIVFGAIANISAKGTRKARAKVDDEEYSRVIHEFYQTYRPLQKRYNLRLHSLLTYTATTI